MHLNKGTVLSKEHNLRRTNLTGRVQWTRSAGHNKLELENQKKIALSWRFLSNNIFFRYKKTLFVH